MADRFVQLVQDDSKRSEYLASTHPLAFALLSIIALRACRVEPNPKGLKFGEALIGDWENSGFSRQNYRTALNHLVVNKFLQIIETNRNRKKSTTGVTTTGTKVKLLNTDIYDINIENGNHRSNHCPTTDQPLTNHEQESKESKYIKETTPKPPKGDRVVFYECLNEKGLESLSDLNKLALMNFKEDRVKAAVAYALSADVEIKTTLIRTLMWHCRQNEAPVIKPKAKSLRELCDLCFVHGEFYNGAECRKDSFGIAFIQGVFSMEARYQFNFKEDFLKLVKSFKLDSYIQKFRG